MKKMKLEDRITSRYILLFLLLMLISNISLIYILGRQDKRRNQTRAIQKSNEINDFLNKVMVFSDRYPSLTLEFSPRLEGQKVIYSKPFNPGEENYLYVLKIVNSRGEAEIPLDTVSSFENETTNENADNNTDSASEELIQELEKYKIPENESTKGKVINLSEKMGDEDNKYYYVFKITREIKGNVFTSYVLQNVSQEKKILRRLELLTAIITVLGIIITAIVSKVLSRRILKPINNITRIAETITTDDLSKRIESPHTEDELEKLTTIINQMLDRIENSFENQSKFVSDASHELRTPLAIIKGYAEIIKKRKLSNPEIFEESIDSIINEADNMKNLVQKLLFLAKGEMSKVNASFREIEAAEMVEQIYSDMEVSIKTHKFVLEKSEKYKLKAEETLLQQAVRALIENAIKYSEKGTNVYIKSEIKDNKARISIRDEGVGIQEEDKKRIFDRFYRVDDSRTKSTGGTGLGLAIVKRIVEIHDGKIEIDSEYNKGTIITIVLPILETKTEKKEKPKEISAPKLKLGIKNIKKQK